MSIINFETLFCYSYEQVNSQITATLFNHIIVDVSQQLFELSKIFEIIEDHVDDST